MSGFDETSSRAALEKYRCAMQPFLKGAQVFEYSMTPMDRLNVPLWSVAIIGEDGALSDGFGYGANEAAAQASAWGEALEWHVARDAMRRLPRLRGTFHDLEKQGHNVLDPVSLCLHAGSEYSHDETECEWIEATRYPDGARAWLPIEFVAPRASDIAHGAKTEDFLVVPITNGLGAGPNFAHALAHGVLELLQRDGNSVRYRALDQGVRIELDEVRDGDVRALLQLLEQQNIEVMAKLATTDFGMANIYVVGYDRNIYQSPQPISLSACGEAVHPDREFALGKALREFVSARARKAFNHGPIEKVRTITPHGYLEAFGTKAMRSEDARAMSEMRRWMQMSHDEFFQMIQHPIFDVRETKRYSGLPTVEPAQVVDAQSRLDVLTQRLRQENLEVWYVLFSSPEDETTVLKAIVPGLEVETMTYNRIGARNCRRLLEDDSPLVQTSSTRSDESKRIRLLSHHEDEMGTLWFNDHAVQQIVGDLYALYREPGRHVVALSEGLSEGTKV